MHLQHDETLIKWEIISKIISVYWERLQLVIYLCFHLHSCKRVDHLNKYFRTFSRSLALPLFIQHLFSPKKKIKEKYWNSLIVFVVFFLVISHPQLLAIYTLFTLYTLTEVDSSLDTFSRSMPSWTAHPTEKCNTDSKLKYLSGDALSASTNCVGPNGAPYPHASIAKMFTHRTSGARKGRAGLASSTTLDPAITKSVLMNTYSAANHDIHSIAARNGNFCLIYFIWFWRRKFVRSKRKSNTNWTCERKNQLKMTKFVFVEFNCTSVTEK